MANAKQLFDLFVEMLTEHPAFQWMVRDLAISHIAESDTVSQKIEDVIETSDRVEMRVEEVASKSRFEGAAFRDAVRDIIRDMDFSVEVR